MRYWTHWYDRARRRRGSIPEVERLIEYIEDYDIDGVVFHQAFSCRTWHSAIMLQAQILKEVYREIPILVMEGDIHRNLGSVSVTLLIPCSLLQGSSLRK